MLRTLNADAAPDHRGRMAPSEPNIGDHARLFLLLAAKDLLADDDRFDPPLIHFEKVLIDFLDLQDVLIFAPYVVADHQLGQLIAVNKDDPLAK